MKNKQVDIKKSSFNSYQLHNMKVIQSRQGKKSSNMSKDTGVTRNLCNLEILAHHKHLTNFI